MTGLRKKEALILFLGDIFIYFLSLWLALFFRHLAIPSGETYFLHLRAFIILFAAWTIIFYIAGLYENHTVVFKGRLPGLITRAGITNIFIVVLFFYFLPVFSISPKTVLVLFLIFSLALLLYWRLSLSRIFLAQKKQEALLVGEGEEMDELLEEVGGNLRYPFRFVSQIFLDRVPESELEQRMMDVINKENISLIVADLNNKKLLTVFPKMYELLFSQVRFLDICPVYEDIFDRLPLGFIGYDWFLANVSITSDRSYDVLKRALDIVGALVIGAFSLVFYPFIILAIKLDDGGVLFNRQDRVGRNGRTVRLLKFRTMTFDDKGEWAKTREENKVTRVGAFLRKSRLDELPQLWNVLVGEISLIGPRPEFASAVSQYEKQIPYYRIRHLIKPGLSGWAQTHHQEHPHHALDVSATRRKLSYDLYYIKHRSFILDIKVVLQTVRILLSRSGR